MDLLPALNRQLNFIRSFYLTAASPFEILLRKYTPRYEACDDEPPDESGEWEEARKGLEVLGQFGLTLVQKAILDYLRFFVIDKIGPDDVRIQKGSAFLMYEKLLLNRTTFRWEDSPVSRNRIEQINLCRNDFIHDSESEIDSSQPRQSADHFQKHPSSPFNDPLDRLARMAFAKANAEEWRETPGLLTVSRYELCSAITAARQFCAFVGTQKAQTVEG